MAKNRLRKKKKNLPIQQPSNQKRSETFSYKLEERLRNKRIPKFFHYNYHSNAFLHFHNKGRQSLASSNNYRKDFWSKVGNGIFEAEAALDHLKTYKLFLENTFQEIIQPYSVAYWLHVSRRILPNTMGDDKRPETIIICRNIINAAIQKYGQLVSCNTLRMSNEIEIKDTFKGLFLTPEFSQDRKLFTEAPPQLVLTEFDEVSLLQYYDLEHLAYEIWLAGAKSRIVAKGASLVVNLNVSQILFDDRNADLAWLTTNFDKRTSGVMASATGTVFTFPDVGNSGEVLLTTVLAERKGDYFIDPVTEHVGLNFQKGQFPNFSFYTLDIKTYLAVHVEFAQDFKNKWQATLAYVIAVLADLTLALNYEIINDKNINVVGNAISRAYRLYDLQEFKAGITMNWQLTMQHLGIDLVENKSEIEKAIEFLSLTETSRKTIFLDSFGPLKVFLPAHKEDQVLVDHSVIGEILFNLFAGLPLKDRNFKGELLERALKVIPSYLPTTECKGLDGSSKQVDYSISKEDILVLAECKAVARSFGVFGGQATALEHRLRNVIHKGLDDVDAKVQWFIKHPKGTNYDLSKFKYIVGVAISPFPEFMPSRDDRYWLNDNLPRVLTISEFESFIAADLHGTIKKNLILLN